jgi:hypothetical protein
MPMKTFDRPYTLQENQRSTKGRAIEVEKEAVSPDFSTGTISI